MKNKKRTLTALLLAVILISNIFGACTGKQNIGGDDTPEEIIDATSNMDEPSDERITADVVPEDFGGYEFRIVTRIISGWNDAFTHHDIVSENITGDIIDDAVYARNLAIEEAYNITVSKIEKEYTNGDFERLLRNMVKTGDNGFDVILPQPASTASLLLEGLFTNLCDVPHIDLTKPWWNVKANESLTINGVLFYAFSDLSIMPKNASAALLFNKKMAEDNGIENMYSLVREGKWDLDKLYDITKDMSRDLNGDGTLKYGDDQFGFLGQSDVMQSFFVGCGELFADKDETGLPRIAFGTEKSYSAFDKITKILYDETIAVNAHKTSDPINNNIKSFSDGRGLFFWENLYIVTALRALDIDFGILPTPKFDESQPEYLTAISQHGSTAVAIPKGVPNLERTGKILEALTAESKYTLQPAYYEIMLKTKYTRDDDSEEMLDVIFKNLVVDIGIFYDFGGFPSAFLSGAVKNEMNIASRFEKSQNVMQKSIDKFIDEFSKIEN